MRFGISSYNWSRAHIAGAQANLDPRRIESTPVCVSQARFSSGPVSSSTGAQGEPDFPDARFFIFRRPIPMTVAS